jgi:hypothetical protein
VVKAVERAGGGTGGGKKGVAITVREVLSIMKRR